MTLYVALASSKGAPAGRGPSTGLWLQDRSQVTCKGPRGSTHRRQDRGGKGRRDAGRALGLGVGGARRRTGLQALGPFGARKKGVGGLASGLRASCRPHSSPLCSWQSRLRVTLRAAPGAQGSPPAACCPPPPPASVCKNRCLWPGDTPPAPGAPCRWGRHSHRDDSASGTLGSGGLWCGTAG